MIRVLLKTFQARTVSDFAIAPEGFQSSHMYRAAPGATDSEQVLVDDGAVLLVCGDDKGQDTAIHKELHAEFFIFREKVAFNDLLQNRFVISNLSSKGNLLDPYFVQS